MEHHCFAFFLTDNKSDIDKILTDKQIEVGSKGIKLFTPIRKWLLFKPADEKGVYPVINGCDCKEIKQQVFLEKCWGIGFRIERLKELFKNPNPWSNYDKERDLTFFELKPNTLLKFDEFDIKRDVIVLCPSDQDCERFVYGHKEYTASTKIKRYKIWHWMSVSHKSIIAYNRNDEEFDTYMKKTFQICNWSEKEHAIEDESSLF